MSLALSILRLISDFSKVITLLSLNFKIIPILQIVDFCPVLFFLLLLAFPICLLKREPAVQHLEPKGRRVKGVFLALQVPQVCHFLVSLSTIYVVHHIKSFLVFICNIATLWVCLWTFCPYHSSYAGCRHHGELETSNDLAFFHGFSWSPDHDWMKMC